MSLFSAVLGLVSGQFALVAFGLLFAGINFCYMCVPNDMDRERAAWTSKSGTEE